MNNINKYILKQGVIFGLLILLTCGSQVLIENVKGYTEPKPLEKGDFICMYKIPGGYGDPQHAVIYWGKGKGNVPWFLESGFLGVARVPAYFVSLFYEKPEYYYVVNANSGLELEDWEKDEIVQNAYDTWWPYYHQNIKTHTICHHDLSDYLLININGHYFDSYPDPITKWDQFQKIKNECVKKFTCLELIWAAYMKYDSDPPLNIAKGPDSVFNYEYPYWGLGKTCWNDICFTNVKNCEYVVKINNVKNPPFPSNIPKIKGTVIGDLNEDDPENYTYTTIQKGINNLSTLDTLYIKNGTYNENIIINKSLFIIGEDKNNVLINGTITINDNHNYELPDYGQNDIIINLSMNENQLLLHMNNDMEIGENYSSSNIVYDYSGQGNNGSNNGATWTTNNIIKGNGSFSFDGIDDKINLTNIPALMGENLTVSSWIYWNGGSDIKDPIISQSNTTHGYCLYVNNTSKKPVFKLDDMEAVSSVNIGKGWHHIVGTHNETTLKIYLNGTLVGTGQKNGNGINSQGFVGFDNASNYFNGLIDETAIWNRTLTDKEITKMYQADYGTLIQNVTLRNVDFGLLLNNNSQIYNCDISNCTVGIQIKNLTTSYIVACNISNCDTAISINNSNPEPEDYQNILIGVINAENCSKGIIINSSSNIRIAACSLNCSNKNIQLNNCNLNNIMIDNCTSPGNTPPDIPSTPSGIALGNPDTKYTYTSVTNDSDDDQIFYQFYWGDGNISDWFGPYQSNEEVSANHTWSNEGGYHVYIRVRDVLDDEYIWSEFLLFQTETLPPLISSVNNTIDIVGFGNNITIIVNASDDQSSNYSGIKYVKSNITFPDDSYKNITLTSIGNNTFQYVFNDTWIVGQYNYTIWVVDNAYNTNSSTGHSFNVSSQATINICTIKDDYGDGETVNLTDPPSQSYDIGYELLDNGDFLHIWNRFDSYYFDANNGIQLTNHYDEYWSHNVLMLSYYNNDQWNLIYHTDELSGFNKEIDTDDWTYVNATLWKDLNYMGYDFRLAIRYHLGIDDNELTVIPYIKNLGQNIPYILGFAWEINDMQVDMTPEDDYIEINNSVYALNATLDLTFTNMTIPQFYIREDISNSKSESLYLRWNESLDYKIQVKSKEGEYNAPVTLGIKIGALNAGQEKYTKIFWHDASEAIYYFDNYDYYNTWANSPGNMVDGSTSTFASTQSNNDIETCISNTCIGSDLGTISKVEIRCHGKYSGSGINPPDISLRVIWSSNSHIFSPNTSADWSNWYDITNDNNAPDPWTWNDVDNLMCEIRSIIQGTYMLYCSKVEIRVTYTPPNEAPFISNPYPTDGTVGIGIQPLLNISVSDSDGDSMNITWLSNSSGSWQVFGTNNSVGNGTYHQTFSNATVNGQWWYWRVNVSDGSNYTMSSVYKFYTGYQSKLINTGNYSIKGYLLIQVQFYNETSEDWIVVDDTINESSPRNIKWEDEGPFKTAGQHILGLDTIFNGRVTTEMLSSFGNGSYRIYAAFRDPYGNVLVCDDENELVATYEFTLTFD